MTITDVVIFHMNTTKSQGHNRRKWHISHFIHSNRILWIKNIEIFRVKFFYSIYDHVFSGKKYSVYDHGLFNILLSNHAGFIQREPSVHIEFVLILSKTSITLQHISRSQYNRSVQKQQAIRAKLHSEIVSAGSRLDHFVSHCRPMKATRERMRSASTDWIINLFCILHFS